MQRVDGGLGQRATVGVVEEDDRDREGPGLLGELGDRVGLQRVARGGPEEQLSDDGNSSRASDVAVGEQVSTPADIRSPSVASATVDDAGPTTVSTPASSEAVDAVGGGGRVGSLVALHAARPAVRGPRRRR